MHLVFSLCGAVRLQELALHRGWRLPDYVVLTEAGPPHMREFTVRCHLEDLTETGQSDVPAEAAAAAASERRR